MSGSRLWPLQPDDLDGELATERADEALLTSALAIGKDLEKLAAEAAIRPSADFGERVWAAIAAEPLPAPITAARSAVRDRSPHAFLVALGDAPRVAFGAGRPLPARGRALALLMAAALVIASVGGAAAAGAATLLNPAPAPTRVATPSPIVKTAEPSPAPAVSPPESDEPEASPNEGPSGDSQAADGATESSEPDASSSASDGQQLGPSPSE